MPDFLRDLPEAPEEWHMPVAWKVLMTALMLEVAELDAVSPDQRTTEMFLRRVEERVELEIPALLESLTLENEAQARMLARQLRCNVEYLRERHLGG